MKTIYAVIIVLVMSAFLPADENVTIESLRMVPDSLSADLIISCSAGPDYSSYELDTPQRLLIKVKNAQLPPEKLTYKVCSPVKRITLTQDSSDPGMINIMIEYDERSNYVISHTENSIYVKFPKSFGQGEEDGGSDTDLSWLVQKINLVVEEGSVASSLNLISRKAGFDLVAAEILENPIWVNLQDVTVEDALTAIVKASGNTFFITGNVVVVTKKSEETDKDLQTRAYKLRYIDAKGFAESIKESLSPNAKIKIVDAAESEGDSQGQGARILLITDYPEKHEMVGDIINQIDSLPPQVAISVKFVETNITGDQNLGLDWNDIFEAKITGADPASTENTFSSGSGLSAFSALPLRNDSFVYGTLTVSEATAILRYLIESGKSRLLSDPSVTTSDGHQAAISVTTTIPIQTVNRFSEGAVVQDIVTYEYKEVGITLDVTPTISDEGRIILDCTPSVEEITGWVGPKDNQQPITTKRSVTTEVVVVNGETLVIGGLYKESKIETESKLWLLGDIPILGKLFKARQIENSKTDLIIFITPTILK